MGHAFPSSKAPVTPGRSFSWRKMWLPRYQHLAPRQGRPLFDVAIILGEKWGKPRKLGDLGPPDVFFPEEIYEHVGFGMILVYAQCVS